MPENVVVDNLKVVAPSVKTIVLANGTITGEGVSAPTYNGEASFNPYVITKTFTVRNNEAGYNYTLPASTDFSRVTVIKEN